MSGECLQFDGVDDWVDIVDDSSLSPTTSSITITAWVKIETGLSTQGFVLSKYNTAGRYEYILEVNNGRVRFGTNRYFDSGYIASINYINDGSWHYVTGVQNSTNQYVYIDGVVDGNPIVRQLINDTANNLIIGSGINAGYPFKGFIDDVRVYNRALSTTEVEAIYNSAK
jgi:hypothetical protein